MKLGNESEHSLFRMGFGTFGMPPIGGSGRLSTTEQEFQDMVKTAYENGVNFYDAAPFQCADSCARLMGECLQEVRDEIWIGSRVPEDFLKGPGDLRKEVERALQLLGTDYLDYYYVCSSFNPKFKRNDVLSATIYRELTQLQEEGMLHHLTFSTGRDPEKAEHIIDTAVNAGNFDSMLTFYSPLFPQMREALHYSKDHQMINLVSAPFLPWKLDSQLAYQYAWNNSDVDCLLITSFNMESLQTNLELERTFRRKATRMEESAWVEITQSLYAKHTLANHHCTGCGKCMPCPKGIRIPEWIRLCKDLLLSDFNEEQFHALEVHTETYGSPLELCDQCGACVMERCPQGFPIPRYMRKLTLDYYLSHKDPDNF